MQHTLVWRTPLRTGRRMGAEAAAAVAVAVAPLLLRPWGVRRAADLPAHAESLHVTTLLDSPFYARTRLDWRETPAGPPASSRAAAMHESVDLDRFSAGWVRFLLPFKMRQERA